MSSSSFITFIAFLCGSIIVLVTNTTGYFSLDILFFISLLILSGILFRHLQRPLNMLLSNFLVFNYLFFFIAPLFQMHAFRGRGSFPNTLPFEYEQVALTIVSIIVFNIIFYISFLAFERKDSALVTPIRNIQEDYTKYRIAAFVMIGMSAISVLFAMQGILTRTEGVVLLEGSKMQDLLVSKIILFIPLFPAIYFAKSFNKRQWFFMILAIMLILFCKNPLLEKRNALGPIYLTIIFFLLPKLMSSNARAIGLMSAALIIVFPLMTIITHKKNADIDTLLYGAQESNYSEMITNVFTELHYDAFSNVAASISYFEHMNVTYGKQLLGSVLFFFPRNMWQGKPWGSGQEIGNYLTNNYLMWFNNLSMPLVGEGWMNFGFFGVIIFAIALAYVVNLFSKWFNSGMFTKQLAAVYFSFHLIFLLRGDLMNGISYFIGPFVAFYIIPNFLHKFFYIRRRLSNAK